MSVESPENIIVSHKAIFGAIIHVRYNMRSSRHEYLINGVTHELIVLARLASLSVAHFEALVALLELRTYSINKVILLY